MSWKSARTPMTARAKASPAFLAESEDGGFNVPRCGCRGGESPLKLWRIGTPRIERLSSFTGSHSFKEHKTLWFSDFSRRRHLYPQNPVRPVSAARVHSHPKDHSVGFHARLFSAKRARENFRMTSSWHRHRAQGASGLQFPRPTQPAPTGPHTPWRTRRWIFPWSRRGAGLLFHCPMRS